MHVTKDVEDFYAESDPDKENLCLYGNPDGTWEAQLPAEEVPPELPEPSLGLHFARDGLQLRTPMQDMLLTHLVRVRRSFSSTIFLLSLT